MVIYAPYRPVKTLALDATGGWDPILSRLAGWTVVHFDRLSEIEPSTTGVALLTRENYDPKSVIALLCEGVQLVFCQSMPERWRDHHGCHELRDAAALPARVEELGEILLNLSVKTRFFNRGRYRLKTGCVSVLVATYRDIAVLDHTIQSLVEQSYDHFELIVINDDPSKESLKQLNEVLDGFDIRDRLTLIQNERNVNQYASMNVGLSYSTGEYVTIVGAGDIVTSDRLETIVRLISTQPDILAVRTRFVRLKNYAQRKRIRGFRDLETTVSCHRSLYQLVGFYDWVLCAGDSAFLYSIPREALFDANRLTYLAIGSGMSTKHLVDRKVYGDSSRDFFRQHFQKGSKPVFNEPFLRHNRYTIPESIRGGT
jgi:hypothetical protein